MGKAKIIIVGAGTAGIAAAKKLLENNFNNFQILEAESRIGGRINSVAFGKSVVDLGAQWCHGEEDNLVFNSVKDLNLLETSKCNYRDNVYYDSNGCVVDKDVTDELSLIAAQIIHEDMTESLESLGDYFIKRYIEEVKKQFGSNKRVLDIASQYVHWFHKMMLCYDAPTSWFDISASGLMQYKECEGDPLLNWKDKGYRKFLDVLMGDKINVIQSKVLLNKEVRRILWNDSEKVTIHCNDGSRYEGDHVILTVSVGVLKERYRSMFVPELPFYKSLAIENQGFGTVNKILLKFPQRWWENETNFCFLWNEDDKMNILNQFPTGPTKNGKSWLEDISGFFVIDSDPTVLLAWMVGEFAKDVELLDNVIIQKGCMFLLEKFLGDKYHIPQPIDILCSKWHSNIHFRGSYSFKSIDGMKRETSTEHLSKPLTGSCNKPLVLFAGEATHPHYYSTVHGAAETGFREAQNIINYYQSSRENPKLTSKY